MLWNNHRESLPSQVDAVANKTRKLRARAKTRLDGSTYQGVDYSFSLGLTRSYQTDHTAFMEFKRGYVTEALRTLGIPVHAFQDMNAGLLQREDAAQALQD